jgi:hypothetical protein
VLPVNVPVEDGTYSATIDLRCVIFCFRPSGHFVKVIKIVLIYVVIFNNDVLYV